MKQSGIPTKKLLNLYKKYSDGEYGVIVTGCIMINGKNLEAPGNVIIDKELESDERREAFKEWTEITKKNGSVFIAQLFHPGKHAIDIAGGNKFDVNTVTREQIDEIVEQYAYAASFAQQCGFNGVEISAAYSYALGQFLTVGSNWRTDEYGGSLENRSRILFRIIHAIRYHI
ncbi:unnamed protein product [Dracunculus medinensis]|uniref:Oxidored_FMN domain-containing protein n=1 Tax=Dracunculus medinensis TaxID=318479 RepID=A0A0N4UDU3_DRAME|nr:unnamed protein product [Dracunculus medinensis]